MERAGLGRPRRRRRGPGGRQFWSVRSRDGNGAGGCGNCRQGRGQRARFCAGESRAIRELNGARGIAREESQSLLRRAVAQGVRLAQLTGPAGKVWRFTASAGRMALVPAEKVLEAAGELNKAWRAVPAVYRKIVYRSLLAVGLLVTISERTIPALGKIGEAAGKFVGEVAKNTASAMAEGLRAAVEKVLDLPHGHSGRWLPWTIYLAVLALLGIMSWKLLPIGKRKLRYVLGRRQDPRGRRSAVRVCLLGSEGSGKTCFLAGLAILAEPNRHTRITVSPTDTPSVDYFDESRGLAASSGRPRPA